MKLKTKLSGLHFVTYSKYFIKASQTKFYKLIPIFFYSNTIILEITFFTNLFIDSFLNYTLFNKNFYWIYHTYKIIF